MPIDPNTGMPELPWGYFWRVTKRDSRVWPLRVELRRRVWIFSVEEGAAISDASKSEILNTASNVVRDWKATSKNGTARFLGDYPTKHLGKVD